MHRAALRPAVIFALGFVATADPAAADPQVITVQANGDLGPFPALASGFIHGLDENGSLEHSAVAPLVPEYWRLYKYVTYEFAAAYDAKIAFELANSYAWAHGGFPNAHPWDDWAGWEQYVTNQWATIRFTFPDDRPAFWDVWNEPDLAYFWSGTYEQLLELYARTITRLRTLEPGAKIVGPSVARYDETANDVRDVVQFAFDLDRLYGVRLDALSWHENDSGVFGDGADKPEDIVDHAASIRTRLPVFLPPDYQPELHVNEYAGNRVHLSPGYNVGYLYYLMEAEVDWASRSCWTVISQGTPPSQAWSDCWSGLDGLHMEDGSTPQIAYWVYEEAVRMRDGVRLPTTIPALRTNVLASRIDSSEEVRLLVGRHEQINPLRDVLVRVSDWPWPDATVRVDAARIPHFPELFDDPPIAIPWPGGPIDAWSATLPVVDGTVEVALDAFQVNDVWKVVVSRPEATAVADASSHPAPDAGFALLGAFPNPFSPGTEIRFSWPVAGPALLDVYDVRGRRAARLVDSRLSAADHRATWNGKDTRGVPVPAGVYFVRLTDGRRTAAMKIVRE